MSLIYYGACEQLQEFMQQVVINFVRWPCLPSLRPMDARPWPRHRYIHSSRKYVGRHSTAPRWWWVSFSFFITCTIYHTHDYPFPNDHLYIVTPIALLWIKTTKEKKTNNEQKKMRQNAHEATLWLGRVCEASRPKKKRRGGKGGERAWVKRWQCETRRNMSNVNVKKKAEG